VHWSVFYHSATRNGVSDDFESLCLIMVCIVERGKAISPTESVKLP